MWVCPGWKLRDSCSTSGTRREEGTAVGKEEEKVQGEGGVKEVQRGCVQVGSCVKGGSNGTKMEGRTAVKKEEGGVQG